MPCAPSELHPPSAGTAGQCPVASPRALGDTFPGSQHNLAATPEWVGPPIRAPHTLSPPFAPQARDCKLVGDLEGAQRHSNRARVANIVCSAVVAVVWVIFIIVAVIIFSTLRAI